VRIAFDLNGAAVEVEADFDALLLDVVRGLGLTGTKECCGVGVCGACSVIVDGRPVSSCLYLAACAEASDVWTVEGLARRAPALIEAFVEAEAMQCGICTPGHVVAAFALALDQGADLTDAPDTDLGRISDAALRHHLAGNLCRCTGYQTIAEAVRGFLVRR
jgi:aerobic-type carbon monoxide dehydrogenase small subunit (CoxS/CutS family)